MPDCIKLWWFYQGAESFTEAMKIGCETYHTLKNVIKKKYGLDGKMCKLTVLQRDV